MWDSRWFWLGEPDAAQKSSRRVWGKPVGTAMLYTSDIFNRSTIGRPIVLTFMHQPHRSYPQ